MAHSKILSMYNCVLALGLTALVAGGLNTWANGVQKTFGVKQRVIEKLYFDDSPVVVSDLKVSGRVVKFGDKFDSDENWLRDLSLKLKNKDQKPVVFVELYFDFPETKATGNIMAYPLRLGRNPRARVPFGESKRLSPEEIVEMAFSEDEYVRLKAFLQERQPIESITEDIIRISEVYAEDGSIWSNGSWVHPDPNNLK